MVLRRRPPVLGGFGAGAAGEAGVSVVEVAGCCRECGEGASVVDRCGAGVRTAVGAGVGVGVGAGEAGVAVCVTALLWISPPSPLVT